MTVCGKEAWGKFNQARSAAEQLCHTHGCLHILTKQLYHPNFQFRKPQSRQI